MTWFPLDKEPGDWSEYFETPDKNDPEQTQLNLKALIKKGEFKKICARNFDVSILQNLDSDIIENGYKVQVLAGPVASYASFFLVKS